FKKIRRMPNTVKGHTLLRHLAETEHQTALARALFSAYFLEGKDIGDDDVLVQIATQHGMTRETVLALVSDEKELAATRAEALAASRQGITGVPFTILNRALAVSGAQSVEVFGKAVAQARSTR